jgi:hypothetical protein
MSTRLAASPKAAGIAALAWESLAVSALSADDLGDHHVVRVDD